MFESLDKMVEIKNNELLTINPFAYINISQDIDHIEDHDNTSVALPVCIEFEAFK